MERKLATAKAGHDKGQLYVVLEETGDYVVLADGKIRTMEHPKRKKKKHIQVVTHLPKEVLELLSSQEPLQNEEIKRAIKLYQKSGCQQQEV